MRLFHHSAPAPRVPVTVLSSIEWANLGIELRQAVEHTHGFSVDVDTAYQFLFENPELFGREDWPVSMPVYAPDALAQSYLAAYLGYSGTSQGVN